VVSSGPRARVRELTVPVARALGRLGLTPNGLTLIGFLGTCGAALAAATQHWLLTGILVLVFGIFDLFDGTLARATGTASSLGAFLDSTLDRAGEALVYIGIVAGLLATGYEVGPVLAAAAMAAAFMVSYTRAKSEGLGFTPGTGMASVGVAPREIRIVILTLGLVLAGILGTAPTSASGDAGAGGGSLPPGILALDLALALIGILAIITTIQRIVHVINQSQRQQTQ